MGYKAPRTFTICGGHSSGLTPVDSTAYYVGGPRATIGTALVTNTIRIPVSGIIRIVNLQIYAGTTAGTAEDWVFSIFDGTTTTAIATVSLAQSMRNWNNKNMNFPVTEGGYISLITTTPAWVTNPDGCSAQYIIVIEYE